jgi:hypothetical protein
MKILTFDVDRAGRITDVGQHITAVSVRVPIELMDEQADVYLAGQIPGE